MGSTAVPRGRGREVAPRAAAVVLLFLAAAGPAAGQACGRCDLLLASDCNFGLWQLLPETNESVFVGATSDVLFDVALTRDGRLFGMDSSARLHELDPCTGGGSVVGSVGGNGLTADVGGADLLAQGPPLTRTATAPPFPGTVVGGAFGPAPPQWCGLSAGDLALHPAEGVLYSTLAGCPDCPGDALVRVAPATGEVLALVGCLRYRSGGAVDEVHGLAFRSDGVLWGVRGFPEASMLKVSTTDALVDVLPLSGGFTCGFGLTAFPCGCPGGDPVPPDQGNVLRAVRALVDVRLDWSGAPATRWALYRDLDKRTLATTLLLPDVGTPGATDPRAVPPPEDLWFYRIRGLSPCSGTPGP